jgi:uncharacterized membrane protein (DUF485 family)
MAKKGRTGEARKVDTHHSDRELAAILMRRQATLSIRVAAVFLVVVLGVPLVNAFLPELSQTPILGFPASWFLLGLFFYPLTWALSTYFVKASEKLEAEEAAMIRAERDGSGRR